MLMSTLGPILSLRSSSHQQKPTLPSYNQHPTQFMYSQQPPTTQTLQVASVGSYNRCYGLWLLFNPSYPMFSVFPAHSKTVVIAS